MSAAPPPPADVVFNSPTDGETDVSPTASDPRAVLEGARRGVARGPRARELRGRPPGADGPTLKTTYDAANRAIEIKFDKPLEPFRTVKMEIVEGVTAFDGGPRSRRGASRSRSAEA